MEVIAITKNIPASTTTAMELARVHVPKCEVVLVYVSIPSGWQYSAGVRIRLEGGGMLLPSIAYGADAWITGDDDHYTFPLNKEIKTEQDLIIEGINNTAYDQPFTMYILYEPKVSKEEGVNE